MSQPQGSVDTEEIGAPDQFAFYTRTYIHSPCQNACPIDLQCYGYLSLIGEGRFEEAYRLIRQRLPFPRTLGRVCDAPCQPVCLRNPMDESVAIKDLKRFAADWAFEHGVKYTPRVKPRRKEKVAVVGAGPAGLSAAHDLAREGFQVTVFDELPVAGGMLAVGVPGHRLPREVLDNEIENVTGLGVEIKLNCPITDVAALLREGYDAAFVAVGTHRGLSLPVPGVDSQDVLTGTAFLRDVLLGKKVELGRKVLVVGGGNVALDCARTALRLGSEVQLVCLESRHTMPAEVDQTEAGEEEGVVIHPARAVTKVTAEGGRVTGVECLEVRRMRFDAEGRLHLETKPGTEHTLPADTVIFAVRQVPNLDGLREKSDLAITSRGFIQVDPGTLATSIPGVFAGGDGATNGGSVVQAIADGQRAALSITSYLNGEQPSPEKRREDDELVAYSREPVSDEHMNRFTPRVMVSPIPVELRRSTFAEVIPAYSEAQAMTEGCRCIRCDLMQSQEKIRAETYRGGNVEADFERIRDDLMPGLLKTRRRNMLHGLGVHKVIKPSRRAEHVFSLSCGVFGMLSEVIASMKLLERLGIEYAFMNEERCCGMPQLELGAGTAEDLKMTHAAVQEFAEWNLARAKELGGKSLSFMCQWCYYIAKKALPDEQEVRLLYYPDILVENLDKIRELKPSLPPTKVAYFEGCHIRNVTYAPGVDIDWGSYRRIVEAIDGVEIVDLPKWKCCVVYREQLVQEAIDKGLSCIVTPCAACWTWLTPRRKGLPVKMVQNLLAEALGIGTEQAVLKAL